MRRFNHAPSTYTVNYLSGYRICVPGAKKELLKKARMEKKKAHDLMGHMHEDQVQKVMKQLGVTLTRGTLGPCKHCAKSKAKQKNVCKESRAKKASKV